MNKYVSNFYDVNKKTQTEQVLENMEQIDELKKADEDLQEDIEAEEQARAEADAELEYSIEDLQSQIDAFGNVFTLKGSVATISDLPAENNNVGDVYYVESEYVGYVWIDDNGSERWEQLGLPVDLSNYVTSTDLTTALEDYQEKLTAGTNITILGNTISAQQPDISGLQVLSGNGAPTTSTIGKYKQFYLDESTKNLYQCTETIYEGNTPVSFEWTLVGGVGKQNKLTAGTNITISGDVISASGGTNNAVTLGTENQTFAGNKTLIFPNNKYFTIKNANQTYNALELSLSTNYHQSWLQFSADGNTIFRIYGDGVVLTKGKEIEFPSKTGTLALISDIDAKVPDAPSSDGTYTLKCVVSNGGTTKTYQWVLDV